MMGIGQRFKSIDDAYKNVIKDMLIPKSAKEGRMADLSGFDKARVGVGTALTDEEMFGAVVRYGVPAAGLTAAGMGLVAVMNQFGGPEDQPEPSTLSMGG